MVSSDSRTSRASTSPASRSAGQSWHTLSAVDTAAALRTDPSVGLTTAAAESRQLEHGPNVLTEAKKKPAWKKVLRLLAEKMTLLLVVAAAVSATVSREWETPVVILAVIILNTVLNYVQESRADSSLEALRKMTVDTSRVRRDGGVQEISNSELVPGDIVLLDAGDSVPADGRLIEAVRLQVAEAALTGESQPVDKTTQMLTDPDLVLADRTNMIFTSTDISRGRAVMVATATGMDTEIGGIASLLGSAGTEKTPLQRRIDQLAGTLTIVALVVVAIVFILGLSRGQPWSDLLITAVSLAVATIPEGLTAVVAFTLSMGASRLARRGAIIKQLSAVETLGSTTHIATDKTGTLTLNEMTVRRLLVAGRSFRITGNGYSTDGKILSRDGGPPPAMTDTFLSMALCNDASVKDGELVGDPTEGALVVLAEKGGIDVEGARKEHPRVAEIPFDSDYKFMATFHRQNFTGGDTAPARFRCFAKGAPGVLMERADSVLTDTGIRLLDDADRQRIHEEVQALAGEGLRTLLIAGRRLDSNLPQDPEELRLTADRLTVYAVVGIVDPPRPEAAAAIATAREAGIEVHMITGDHLVTASAIAAGLGIRGEAAAGTDLDRLDDAQLTRRVAGYGVLARVAPEHKIRVVKALQDGGNVVAMTGDGVNDAPALKQADIGIAMGITGTDVSKGAARMILTDDNFATIVIAVEIGRGVYANIIKFVKFQLTTAWGFVLIFLTAGVLGLAGGAPFTALQILWVNIIMDGPPALALGVDPAEPDIMKQKPRPVGEPLLTRDRLLRILGLGTVMAAGTIAVLVLAPALFPENTADPALPTTLAFTTFVFYQVFNLLNVRSDSASVFSRQTFTNRSIWVSLIAVIVLQIMVVNLEVLQGLFDTTAMSSAQWGLALLVGSSVLWAEEIRKTIIRRRNRRQSSPTPTGPGRRS
ncbi:cation-translocating P-type ATPase [Pseudarthrobacter raffinosi]|uniref:cation-translocating P-type ATPase n=1 Tax=Pseudarthrobacter raffinosi TaxID=2953651 RepID=UPI00208F3853|nr:cation-translocating P-type ATPase [Pseudarthrobacter sp. MDT3-9]MCO4253433.1 cation-translocating P-type ATPase [Pseudarthrobacter sp. MDT3-9]